MTIALSIENVSKQYRLGRLSSRTAAEDIRRIVLEKLFRRPQKADDDLTIDHGNREGGRIWALRDVSFEVREGEVLGLIGRNGAGKSTLLKILSQITSPTQGCIRLKGRLASLLEVGTGFNGELTGRENIFLNGSILGMTQAEIRRHFDAIVDFAEIEKFIDTPVKRYSSGMFVRLAFAVAAHLEAEIMVIDEVLAVGDLGFQKKCLGSLSDASRAGRTVIFVSHRMDHISALCPRSIVLSAGRKVFDGETEQALAHYYRLFQQANQLAISDRKDRQGRGRVMIVDAWVENASGDRVETIITGQAVSFRMRLRNMTESMIRNLNASFAVFSQNNLYVANLSVHEGARDSFDIERECIVSIQVPRFPLSAGQFYVNCVVRTSSGAFEYDDFVEEAILFSVDYGDFHGVGSASGGFLSIEHTATVVNVVVPPSGGAPSP